MKGAIIAGAVNIVGSATNQSLRHVFSNVEFQGTFSYPSAVSSAGWLYFFECSVANVNSTGIYL